MTRIKPHNVIQTKRCNMFAFRGAMHPPAMVFFPIETDFTVEEHGNYRKIRFKGAPEGAPGSSPTEITVGNEKKQVFTVDVETSLRRILAMKKDPTAVYAWWTSPEWKSTEAPGYVRTFQVQDKEWLVTVSSLKHDEEGIQAQDVQRAIEEFLRGADLGSLESPSSVDVVVISGDKHTSVTMQLMRVD